MPKLKDLSGRTFGKWLVLSLARTSPTFFRCRCQGCGLEKDVRSAELQAGRTTSCGKMGCAPPVNRRPIREKGEASRRSLLNLYKVSARRRNITWELPEQEAFELFSGNCYYCGESPKQVHVRKRNYGNFTYNGIDRMDNSQGYQTGNCVSCCGPCNQGKMAMSHDAFIGMAVRIALKHGHVVPAAGAQ